MAGDWIKMRADLLTHPKVVRISSALKADKLRVIGGLHTVWSLFDAHSVDGTLDGYTSVALDDYIGWPGFSASMMLVGWLTENGESLATPRFDEHNGQSAKRRATETQRKRMAREEVELSAVDADKLRSREEKRREDKKETKEDKDTACRVAPVGVCDSVWDDFLKIRRAKKSPMTNTALAGIRREADAAGVTLETALKTCCERGWVGFKADWMTGSASTQSSGETTYQKSMRLRVAEVAPELARGPPGLTPNQFFERPDLQVLEMEK